MNPSLAIDSAPVQVTQIDRTGVIELARPAKFNCLSSASLELIEAAFERFEGPDSNVATVLIRAQGTHFCTGADLAAVLPLRADLEQMTQFVHGAHRVLDRLEASPLPVVVACQGLALAGGLELMLACDVAFAASDARFGDQHAQFGLLPGWGGSQRLTRLVGARRALDLLFSARWVDAETALQWGLVNYVVAPEALHAAALAYCATLGTRSGVGLATMKQLARQGLEGTLAAGLELERSRVPAGLLHADAGEGFAAFLERRAPRFNT